MVARLQRSCSGSLIRPLISTIGPRDVVGPRNITLVQWLWTLVRCSLLALIALTLFTIIELDIMVRAGSRLSTVPETTDPLEFDVFIRLMCRVLVTLKLMLCMTGVLLTVTPRL